MGVWTPSSVSDDPNPAKEEDPTGNGGGDEVDGGWPTRRPSPSLFISTAERHQCIAP